MVSLQGDHLRNVVLAMSPHLSAVLSVALHSLISLPKLPALALGVIVHTLHSVIRSSLDPIDQVR